MVTVVSLRGALSEDRSDLSLSLVSKLKLKLNYDRRSVGQCLGAGHPSRAHDQIFFLSDDCGFLDVGRPL
jgi:hypothetical protein